MAPARNHAETQEVVLVMTPVTYHSTEVKGLKVFYRQSGPSDAPALLLLHGYPSASHMFRNLIPQLADRFHVIAPDLIGFGQSDMPSRDKYSYTFEALTDALDSFTDAIGLDRYALYVFDYGAPTGFRLAVRHPDQITAIITQNGNAYEEGLSDGWNPIRAYWKEPTQANRDAIRSLVQPETTVWQYTHGVPDPSLVSPDGYTLDNHYLARPGAHEIQLDLFLDYASNIKLYPEFQEYFRTRRPPLLAIWGRNDPFFLPAGADTFKRDIPGADIRLLDTGHFALETHAGEIATAIRGFLTG
jgi:pimeloyl-ACP methyl ester carboxylesterase